MIALRTSTCVIALNSMVAAVSMMARAADETLACQGTANMTGIGDTGPVSMGLVVDLRARTVAGFREQFTNYQMPLKITQVKEEVLVLGGQLDLPGRSIM